MKPRRRSRCLSLEILYEVDIAERNPYSVLQRRLREHNDGERSEDGPLESSTADFARHILMGVDETQHNLNEIIVRFAPEWPLHQIAVVDRNILRIAIYEVLFDEGTPVKVAINEAVELAKLYGSDSSPRFVNGVLGTLTEQIESLKLEYLAEAIGE